MGSDYDARKQAKSNRRSLGKANAGPVRVRKKKNQPRRLCRGPCFGVPDLEVDSDAEDGGMRQKQPPAARKAPSAALEEAKKRKRSREEEVEEQPSEDGIPPKHQAKRPKLSTQVQLLDPSARSKKSNPAAASGDLSALPDVFQAFLSAQGLAAPMPVQAACWPQLVAGRDVEAVAEPGSGKTLAYLLPCVAKLAADAEENEATEGGRKTPSKRSSSSTPCTPKALILLPTRELAQQVEGVWRLLRRRCGAPAAACLVGGLAKEPQAKALGKRPPVVIATPGRLLDHLEDGHITLDCVDYVVLDEADMMLGRGFAPQVERVQSLLFAPSSQDSNPSKPSQPRSRPQVGLFTATMPPAVRAVAAAWLQSPHRVAITSQGHQAPGGAADTAPTAAGTTAGATGNAGPSAGLAVSPTVVQVVQVCAAHKKPAKLLKHLAAVKEASLGQRHAPRVLIFANRIKTVRAVWKSVATAGYRAVQLHGERTQAERDAAVGDFKSGKVQILVASDVAARGLDIKRLPYIVNYDFPGSLETYVHRAGRTGRLSESGHAFSFLTREMAPLAGPLLQLLRAHDQAVDPNLVQLEEAYRVAAEKLGLKKAQPAVGDAGEVREKGEEEGGGEERTQQQQRPATNDVLRELDMKPKKVKKKRETPATAEDADAGAAAAPKEVKILAAAASPRKEEAFIASKRFAGAKAGYCFKNGRMGVGYYLDRPLLKPSAAAATPAGRKGKAPSRMPIGGVAAAAAATGKKKSAPRGEEEMKKEKAKQPPLLPGKLKKLKRQQEEQPPWSSSDEEEDAEQEERGSKPPPLAQRLKSRGSLPGRLRKKLAKERQGKKA